MSGRLLRTMPTRRFARNVLRLRVQPMKCVCRRANRVNVFLGGLLAQTIGRLTQGSLMKNKKGKIVSCKMSAAAKHRGGWQREATSRPSLR